MFNLTSKCAQDLKDLHGVVSTVTSADAVGKRMVRTMENDQFSGFEITKVEPSEAIHLVRKFMEFEKAPSDSNYLENSGGILGWVLFENGTFVVIPALDHDMGSSEDQKQAAINVLRTYGPVYLGVPEGDHSVAQVTPESYGASGWIVLGYHPLIATCLTPNEFVSSPDSVNIGVIGFYGREKRDLDASQPVAIHHEIINN